MGSIISLPVTMAGNWLAACLGASCCSCCVNTKLNPLAHTFQSSIATRIMYAVLFCINSAISWLCMSKKFTRLAEKLAVGPFKSASAYCRGKGCTGFANAQRINFSLGMIHVAMALLTIGVQSTKDPRAIIQNGYWVAKLVVLTLISTVCFLIPDQFFVFWGNYLSIFFGTLFLIVGLILLVDFAHEWAETCLEKIDEGQIFLDDGYGDTIDDGSSANGFGSLFQDERFWRTILVGGTAAMYAGTLLMTGLMYHFFAQSWCGMNTAFISVNVVLAVAATVLSILPVVQEYNPNAGLAQASMCCVYCTYLIFSACLSEPDDKKCNPLIRSSGTRTLTTLVGALFTFVAIAYTTTRAAGNSTFNHSSANPNYADSENYDSVLDILTQEPEERNQMRYAAIQEAVNEGSLPESALSDPAFMGSAGDDGDASVTKSKTATKYNYTLFHVIFFLATQYMAALLTINVESGEADGFVPVGRTYFNTWLKTVSSWVCYLLYAWTLIAPVLFPDRFL
ncbi:TMS1 [Brettanomyces bruxellensis]|uniref:DEBR0S4_01508g1_1 n=1 Tax=Dekkera bruxellensis TaxID=5007 RepID=A0A7D9CYD0_DEKBR|nr:TMS1 [Brettanomyces bruxellensis]